MGTSSLPDTIRTILDQAGGLGLRGAFTYIGAQRFTYRCAEPVGEYRSGRMPDRVRNIRQLAGGRAVRHRQGNGVVTFIAPRLESLSLLALNHA